MALIRRARIGRDRKAAAMIIASYADSSGRSIYCGISRLALDLEVSYSTAKRYLKWLRDVQLIERVRKGNARRGQSDQYRLIFGPDLIEHIELPDPAEYESLRWDVRDQQKAYQRTRRDPLPVENQPELGFTQMTHDNTDLDNIMVHLDEPWSANHGSSKVTPHLPERTTYHTHTPMVDLCTIASGTRKRARASPVDRAP